MVEVVDAGRGSQSQLFSIETRLIHFVTVVFVTERDLGYVNWRAIVIRFRISINSNRRL